MSRMASALAALLFALTLTSGTAQAQEITRVVLAVDVSSSMRGERIESARTAAATFIAELPASVEVGLVTFNDRAQVAVKPTTNRRTMIAALSRLDPQGKTALYDAMELALGLASGSSSRIVLLTDGSDNASGLALGDITSRIGTAAVPVDVVALATSGQERQDLLLLATSAGGRLLTAETARNLTDAFEKAAQVYVPPVGSTATASTSDTGISMPIALVVVVLLAGSGAIVLILKALRTGSRRSDISQRLGQFSAPAVSGRRPAAADVSDDERDDDDVVRRRVRPKKQDKAVGLLAAAGMSITPRKWLMWRAAAGAFLILPMLAVVGFPAALVVGPVLAVFGGQSILKRRTQARMSEFEKELPDFLLLLASALRSGLPFLSALESSANEAPGEVGVQMTMAVREIHIGVPLEDALVGVAQRMQSQDLRWVVTALGIQREVGGNLSGILDTTARTIKSRAELGNEIRTLSAEGRLSAYVLIALPVLVFGFLLLTRRQYVEIFWTEPVGYLMSSMMLVSFAGGWFWMRKITDLKV
jgi:Flp pilus assembly protein TadB